MEANNIYVDVTWYKINGFSMEEVMVACTSKPYAGEVYKGLYHKSKILSLDNRFHTSNALSLEKTHRYPLV
jgi:hypothetical protein